MQRENNILLSRSEWDAFERKLNTYDADRERRAEAFLNEYDGLVTVTERAHGVEIDIPWLNDGDLLSLLGIEEEKHSTEVVSTMQFTDSFESVPTEVVFTSTKHGSSTPSGMDFYAQMVSSAIKHGFSSLPGEKESLKGA